MGELYNFEQQFRSGLQKRGAVCCVSAGQDVHAWLEVNGRLVNPADIFRVNLNLALEFFRELIGDYLDDWRIFLSVAWYIYGYEPLGVFRRL